MRVRKTVGVVAALVLAGCGSTSQGAEGSTPPGAQSSAPPASVAPAGGPVPRGFVAADFTSVSPDLGWVLGTAPCAAAACTSIVRSTDGGKTWVGLPAPKAELEDAGPTACEGKPCVRGIRFATADVGYVYGSTGLYLTRDGGATWTKTAGQADAIEAGNGTVIRVSHDTQGCPPGCTFQISTAPVGSTDWQRAQVPGAPMLGTYVQLVRTGKLAFVQIHANPAGGAEDAHTGLLASTDNGRSWTAHDDPCGTRDGGEADGAQLATGDDGSLSVLCVPRGGGTDFVITSLDGGAHFGAQRSVTTGATGDGLASASGSTLVVTAVTGATFTLYRSIDAGSTWQQVATAPAPGQDSTGSAPIGFQNATVGRFATHTHALLSTTDGGASWATYTFR